MAVRTKRAGSTLAAYLIKGDDASLVAQAAKTLIDTVVGERDSTLIVEEHGGPAADDLDVGAIVDACTTPPFLIDQRVVVVREAGRLTAADAKRIEATLTDPLDTTVLVLVAGGGTIPASLVKAVTAVGEVLDASVGIGRQRKEWLAETLADAPVRLDAGAANRLGDHLGEDLGRLSGILQTLVSAYGPGASINVDKLEPYLGEAGAVLPWDLTDAIDAGAVQSALETLARMLGPGGRAAPEVIGLLHRHFSNMLRLDGGAVTSGEEAALLLGIKSPFVAKKALAQGGRLGSEHVAQAVCLIADADLDVKGRTGLPPDLVLEILVARLSRMVRTRQGARS